MTTTGVTSTASTASIAKTLGSGSGIDIGTLVTNLVAAQFATKKAQLGARSDTLTAQISGVAKLKSGITGFDAALKTLVKGGSLATQPTSSASGVATVALLRGAKLTGLAAQITIDQLASAQAATTREAMPRDLGFAKGSLTIALGTRTVAPDGSAAFSPARSTTIAVPDGATLDQVAARINAEPGLGLTASVIGEGNGARLSIKGGTGAAQAFEITGATDGDAPTTAGDGTPLVREGLARLTVRTDDSAAGMKLGSAAADARLALDGASYTRATNSVSDLVAGVKLDLVAKGTVTLGTSSPSAALAQAVGDFVDTFNGIRAVVKEETDPVSGALRGDATAATLARDLGQLTTATLQPATVPGAPRTLADLGVRTLRDGTLELDAARLDQALAAHPQAVEALFAAGAGLSAELSRIASRATDRGAGLDAATSRYTLLQSGIANQQAAASDAATALTTRLTRQFASMDSRIAAYKSTQTFLDNQIKAWNRSDS